jgi:hypothetical protein
MLNQSSSPFSIFQMFSDCRPFSIGLLVSILMALFSAQFAIAGSYESAELTSSELQSLFKTGLAFMLNSPPLF